METQAGEQGDRTSSGRIASSADDGQHGAPSNGTVADDRGHAQGAASGQYIGPRVTPSTFKLNETPEERDERIRRTREGLAALRAKTPEEAEEQRETLEFLMAALKESRAMSGQQPTDE
jgi:hypothetical protein